MEFPSRAGDELEGLPLVLIMVKTEGWGCVPPFSLQSVEGLRVLSFAIPLNIEGHCCGVDGCNLSNIDDFGLNVVLSPLSFPASFAMP